MAGGIELSEEDAHPFGLVGLTDLCGHLAEAAQAAEETPVRLVGPAHVPRASPAVGTQGVETTVVPDAIGGVPLDRVATMVAECLPGDERARVSGHEVGEARTHLIGRRSQRLLQFVAHAGVLERQHGAGRTLRGEMNGLIAHAHTLRRMVLHMSALSVDSAKNIAIGVAVLFVVLSIVSAIVVKTIVTKVIMIVVLAGLALGAWTQRAALQDCVDKGQNEITTGAAGVGTVTCTFFGTDIEVPAP